MLLPVELTVLAALTLVTVRADCWFNGLASAAVAAVEDDSCGYATEPEPPPDGSTEVTDVEIEHDRSTVHVTVHVEDIPSAADNGTTVYLQTPAGGGQVDVSRSSGEAQPFVSFMDLPDYEAYDEMYDGSESVECGLVSIGTVGQPCDVAGDLDDVHDVVEVRVPRSCLGFPSWVRVGVMAFSSEPGDPDSYRTAYWQPDDTPPPSGFSPPYGPRVPLT